MLPDRNAARPARDGADGRPRQLHDGDAEHRGGRRRRSRRSSRAIPKRRTCTTPTASILLQEQPDKAIEEFKRELELQPGHPWSLMQIAFEYLKRGDGATALPWAQQAVAAAPTAFRGAQGARPGAARHRRRRRRDQGAAASASSWRPRARACTFTLARAYQRAGRHEDATREREEFTRLDRLARDAAQRRAVGRRALIRQVIEDGIAE